MMLRFVARAVPQNRILSSLQPLINRSNTKSNNVTTTKDLTQRCIGTTSIFKDSLQSLQQTSLDYQQSLLKPSLVKPLPLLNNRLLKPCILPNGSGLTNGGTTGWGFGDTGLFLPTTSDKEPILTYSEVQDIVDRIILDEHPALFNDLSQGLAIGSIFYTASNNLEREGCASSTRRGYGKADPYWPEHSPQYQAKKDDGSPVPEVITGNQWKGVLYSRTIPLFESTLQCNTREVEDELQRRFMPYLFNKRLAAKAKQLPPDGKVHTCAMMYSYTVVDFINEGDVVMRKKRYQ